MTPKWERPSILILTLSVLLSAPILTHARAAEPIAFSELILPLSTLTQVMWQPFTADAGYSYWIRQYGTRRANGLNVILSSSGVTTARITARSDLSPDRRHRLVELKMEGTDGSPKFAFKFVTEGIDLAAYDSALVESGRLPFYPTDAGASKTDFRFGIGDTGDALRVVTTKTGDQNSGKIDARFTSTGGEFLVYSEQFSPTTRELSYELLGGGGSRKFTVRKVKLPELWEGTETYTIDGAPVTLQNFYQAFQESVLSIVAAQWPMIISLINQIIVGSAK
jgi:hypothetical protein